MKRPPATTIWAALFFIVAVEGLVFAARPFAVRGSILVVSHATPMWIYVAAAAIGGLLLAFPRAGVLCALTMLGSTAVGDIAQAIRYALFMNQPLFIEPATWFGAAVFGAMALSTLPFWRRTPWEAWERRA